jgi:hypothetical protein
MDRQFENLSLEKNIRKSLIINDNESTIQDIEILSATNNVLLNISQNHNESSVIDALKLKRKSLIKNIDSLPQSSDCTK